jgi:hypothetical protein
MAPETHDGCVPLKAHIDAILAEREKAIAVALEAGRSNVRTLIAALVLIVMVMGLVFSAVLIILKGLHP